MFEAKILGSNRSDGVTSGQIMDDGVGFGSLWRFVAVDAQTRWRWRVSGRFPGTLRSTNPHSCATRTLIIEPGLMTGRRGEKKRLVPRENWEINAVGGDLRNARSRAFAEAARFPRLPWTFGGGGPGRRGRFEVFQAHCEKFLSAPDSSHCPRSQYFTLGQEIICFFFCLSA